MDEETWLLSASVAVLAGCLTFALLAATTLLLGRREQSSSLLGTKPLIPHAEMDTAFLFDDEVLVDATPSARQLLSLAQRGGSCWARLMLILRTRFPHVEDRLAELLDRGTISLTSDDGRSLLRAEWHEGLARLQLQDIDPGSGEGAVHIDRLALQAMQQELDLFRSLASKFPYPCWTEAKDGRINWANSAYLELAEGHVQASGFPSWPPQRVFPDFPPRQSARFSVKARDESLAWFDVEHVALAETGLKVAVPADHIVAAESSRQALLQTLTKTFATLTVGLAVFDRQRRLVLFNPALAELTQAPTEFLAQRPSFDAFVERLRDARILPEPRDFNSWKQTMSRAVSEAEQGTLAESWALPDGRTYNVQGRPISEDAIAFVVQDVTDGMRLTRQFRSDLTMHQDVLDRLEDPLVVFAADGSLFSANAAYRRLWGAEAEAPIAEAQKIWQKRCEAAASWDIDELEAEGRTVHGRLGDGRKVLANLVPLPAGATMVRFSLSGVLPKAIAAQRSSGAHP